jgi:hypothetical protein
VPCSAGFGDVLCSRGWERWLIHCIPCALKITRVGSMDKTILSLVPYTCGWDHRMKPLYPLCPRYKMGGSMDKTLHPLCPWFSSLLFFPFLFFSFSSLSFPFFVVFVFFLFSLFLCWCSVLFSSSLCPVWLRCVGCGVFFSAGDLRGPGMAPPSDLPLSLGSTR